MTIRYRVSIALLILCLTLVALAPATVQSKPVPPTATPGISVTALKGLAQADWGHNEDRAALGALWWYAWSDGNRQEPAVNMSKYGALSIGCYPYLLFLNEPENTQDVNLTPDQAVPLVVSQKEHCPGTKLVIGNSMSPAWLRDFVVAYQNSTGSAYLDFVGYHAYCWYTVTSCISDLNQMHSLLPTYRVWVTEFNCVYCSVSAFTQLVSTVGRASFVDRYAVYTNRQPCSTDCSWVMDGANLVNSDGTLTSNGQAYRDWHGQGK